MIIYGLGLLPLSESLLRSHPDVLQPWYADDAAAQGDAQELAQWMAKLMDEGPARGYFPEAQKSILLIHPHLEAAAVCDALGQFSRCRNGKASATLAATLATWTKKGSGLRPR